MGWDWMKSTCGKCGKGSLKNNFVIINAVFSSVKPIPAAAQPEYEFNIDITTGISAPPIGITTKKPSKIEINTIVQNKI